MKEPANAASAGTELVELDARGVSERLDRADLSEWFNPFLPHFARETIASGGRVRVALEDDRVLGLLLHDGSERTASVFSRSRELVASLSRSVADAAVYAEVELERPCERFAVCKVPLVGEPQHRFRHRVRVASEADLEPVAQLLGEVYGISSRRWLDATREEGETCLVVDLDGQLAGAAWVLPAGACARLHTLTVRPGARRLGIGTDLVFARLSFAWRGGAHEALSEISESNVASRAVAERAGMRAVGRLFLYPSPAIAPGNPNALAGPTAGSSPTIG